MSPELEAAPDGQELQLVLPAGDVMAVCNLIATLKIASGFAPLRRALLGFAVKAAGGEGKGVDASYPIDVTLPAAAVRALMRLLDQQDIGSGFDLLQAEIDRQATAQLTAPAAAEAVAKTPPPRTGSRPKAKRRH